MKLNVFTKPKETFKDALENPGLAVALLIAIVAGVLMGIASFVYASNPLAIMISVVAVAAQWLVMSALLWAFEFMFRGKKKGFREKSFGEIASAVGRLWLIFAAAAALFNVAILALLAGLLLLSAVFVILIGILFIVSIFASYSMVKVVLEAERGKAIVAWLLLIALNVLIFAVAQLAWARILG